MHQDTRDAAEASNPAPPDIEEMRTSARILLADDAVPPATVDLDTLTAALRGHMESLIPDVALAAGRLSKDDIPRWCALACVGEARGKLRAAPGLAGGVVYARKLARSLNALCDHWENLHGVRPGTGR